MKGVKGKLLKKLKTIKTIGYLKPERILHVSASDGFIDNFLSKSISIVHTQLFTKEEPPKKIPDPVQEPEIIDVSDLMKDLEEEDREFDHETGDGLNDKENIRPESNWPDPNVSKWNLGILSLSREINENLESPVLQEQEGGDQKRENKATPLLEIDISSFQPPDSDLGTLFDPNLLAAFEQAVMEVKAQEADRKARVCPEIEEQPPLKARKIEKIHDPLFDFKESCPPGGSDSVIFYTTGLRGIRKTFEDCTSIRFLLESFRVLYIERDLSMHVEFREELWRVLGGKVVPPRLFIKGRYIGGAEEVLGLHERGELRRLFDGIPIDQSEAPCDGCAGARFMVCFNCNGSRKIVEEEDEGVRRTECPECNENGLIVCPVCC